MGDHHGLAGRTPPIDGLDEQIIRALQDNGRQPFRRIADTVGVSEATVRARYARLTSDDVLRVTGVMNRAALGVEVLAMVGVKVSGAPEPVADEIAGWPEAEEVVVTAGRFDLLVELACADQARLRRLINQVRALPDVASTESFLYLETYKQRHAWRTTQAGGRDDR